MTDPAVAAVIATYPPPVRTGIHAVRTLILETAAGLPEVGPLTETLRWGQPSYLTATSHSGTTIRLGRHRSLPDTFGLFVHCGTTLVATFRRLYPNVLDLVGNREIRFTAGHPLPVVELRHCVELALTYHHRR